MNVSYSVKQLTKALNNLQQTHIDSKQLQELLTSSIDDKRSKIVAAAIQEHVERVETYKQILKQAHSYISRDAGAQNFKIFINCDAIRGINLDVIVVENPSVFDNTQKIKILEYCNTLGIVPIAVGAGGWSYKE